MANEKRLIDANELLLSIRTTIVRSKYKYAKNPIMSTVLDGFDELVMGKVKNVPTVEAVEVPPVKIGDTAYFIIQGKIYEAKIVLLQWLQRSNRTDTEIRGEVIPNHSVSVDFSDWGKTVFATAEEAQAKLDVERKYNG